MYLSEIEIKLKDFPSNSSYADLNTKSNFKYSFLTYRVILADVSKILENCD